MLHSVGYIFVYGKVQIEPLRLVLLRKRRTPCGHYTYQQL